jgi:hypothetical protein
MESKSIIAFVVTTFADKSDATKMILLKRKWKEFWYFVSTSGNLSDLENSWNIDLLQLSPWMVLVTMSIPLSPGTTACCS